MTDILYALIAIICAIMLEILLNRTFRLKSEDESDKAFAALLIVAFVFCIVDAFWGLSDSHAIELSDTAMTVLTAVTFILGGAVALAWLVYVDVYVGGRLPVTIAIGGVLFLAQVILLVVNLKNGMIYTVDEGAYVESYARPFIFVVWILFYVFAAVKMTVRYVGLRGDYRRKRCAAVIFCSLIPVVMNVFKIFYSRAPFCAIGAMMSAVIIFIFNISSEYEHLITLENQLTKMASRQNRETINAVAQLFKLMMVINIKLGRIRTLKSSPDEKRDKTNDEPAEAYLSGLIFERIDQGYTADMQEFVRLDTLAERLKTKTTVSHEYMVKDGGWCRAYFIKINEDEERNPYEVIFAVENIDDEKLAELEHNKSVEGENAIYHEMLLAQSDGMLVTDMDDNVMLMNDAAGRMFGVPDPRNTKVTVDELIARCETDDKEKLLDMLIALKAIGGRRSYEFAINHEDSKISVMATTYVTELKESNMTVVITSMTDISAKKSLEKALTAMSETDALTGISNRGGGEAKIMKLLEDGTPGMFALMDVDKFKSVNDTFGHGVGDKVLIEVAGCLVRSFRDADIVMRLGGDEFAVYATGMTKPEAANACLNRLYSEVDKIDVEEMRGTGHKVSISLGAVFCTKHQVQTFDELYQQADAVMYVSKRGGGNHFQIA
jgi:diguanylate cyclase (GGDEF)-like protein